MLKHLAEYLVNFYSGFNAFTYITLRSVMSVLTALAASLAFGPLIIRLLERMRARQTVRAEGPSTHYAKQGTPTMGGLLLLPAIVLSSLLWADIFNRYVQLCLLTLLLFAGIGAVDDCLKLRLRDSGGLSVKWKFMLQAFAGALIVGLLNATAEAPQETTLIVPLLKDLAPNLGPWFMLLAWIVIVGASNAVNLTDGLDGLAIMPVVMIVGALCVFAYASGHVSLAEYLAIPHLPLSGELAVFGSAIIGAGLGFLWFNTYPAQVFMGDIGALALGAAIGLMAVLVRQEIVLAIMGGVFVVETLSVVVQVASYKATGRRVFRMAPLHHHFELRGWPEPRVIVRFWIITVILVLVGLATLKIR